MKILLCSVIYLFFGMPMILNLVKLYEYATSDKYGGHTKWKKAGTVIYIIFLNFFVLVFGAVLVFKDLWKIRYENYLVMAQICLMMTLIFCYLFSKFRKKKTEIDYFITRYILFYTVPFFILFSGLKKIV